MSAPARVDVSRIDIADPATYAVEVPHAEFARRRAFDPVSWTLEPSLVRHGAAGRVTEHGTGFWAVTRHADVFDASRRPGDFSSGAKGSFLRDPRTPGELRQARALLVNMDAPHHPRIRRLVASVFTPRAIAQLADSVAAHAGRLVATCVELGAFDAVGDLARELPLLVLSDLLGLPPADRHRLAEWGDQLVGFDDPEYGGGDVDAYRRAMAGAFGYAMKAADRHRSHPDGSLGSLLATAEIDGVPLTDREYCSFWLLLVVAGNETTRHLVSGSVRALAEHPEQRDALCHGDIEMATAVDELLRWTTPIMQFRRTAVRDVELGGQPIAAGDKVVLFHTSANRDEAVFTDPDRLDLARTPNPHLAFGTGPHACIGAHLARTELAAVLTALRPHLPGLELAGPVTRLASNFVNASVSMPVRVR